MHKFTSTHAMVRSERPEHPVYCLRPRSVTVATRWFLDRFPGRVLYAVKTNPHPRVLGAVVAAGLDHFDVASLAEIETVRATAPGTPESRARMDVRCDNCQQVYEFDESRMKDGGVTNLETGFSYTVIRELMMRGHTIEYADGPYGGYQAIMKHPEYGVYFGASESRKDGQAAGY